MEAIAAGKDALQEAQSGRKSRFFSLAILLDLVVSDTSYWSSSKEVLRHFHDYGIYAVVATYFSDGAGHRIKVSR